MTPHVVRPYKSSENLAREHQLAWKIASVAADDAPLDAEVIEMIGNRIINNTAVAAASLANHSVANARAQALAHSGKSGACVYGLGPDTRVSPEWATWVNATGVRELDFHDTYVAVASGHPGDNISPVLAVGQHCGLSGMQLARGIAAGYEIQVALVKSLPLNDFKIDQIANLGPSATAGIGAALGLREEVIYQAVQQAVQVTTQTRQTRKGAISSWKAYAAGFAGKMAVEAVDRAMRGEASPSPIYEGDEGFIAVMLGGLDVKYTVNLPAKGEPKRAILETFVKEHSAEYFSQALIDLARKMKTRIDDLSKVKDIVIHSSSRTHHFIGMGANDPQKMDPKASRETLDHSIMYIFAVVLEDGDLHHEHSYAPERVNRPSTIALWQKIRTVADEEWSRRYSSPDPKQRAIGGRVVVTMQDGRVIEDEVAFADAHPLGARPFKRPDYIRKFRTLAEGIIERPEQDRFLAAVDRLTELRPGELSQLSFAAKPGCVAGTAKRGLFDWSRG